MGCCSDISGEIHGISRESFELIESDLRDHFGSSEWSEDADMGGTLSVASYAKHYDLEEKGGILDKIAFVMDEGGSGELQWSGEEWDAQSTFFFAPGQWKELPVEFRFPESPFKAKPVPAGRWLIMKAWTFDEYLSPMIEYAVAEITPELIAGIQREQVAVKNLKIGDYGNPHRPHSVEYEDCTPDFLSDPRDEDGCDEATEELLLDVDSHETVITDTLPPFLAEYLRKDSDLCTDIIRRRWLFDDRFRWTGFYKNTGISFETASVKIADLTKK